MSTEIIKLDRPQTNCTVKNEKGQACAGHLKEFMTAPENLRKQLPPKFILYRCKRCQVIYMSPPQQHLQINKNRQEEFSLPPQTDEEPELLK